jgi:hypothetical protein
LVIPEIKAERGGGGIPLIFRGASLNPSCSFNIAPNFIFGQKSTAEPPVAGGIGMLRLRNEDRFALLISALSRTDAGVIGTYTPEIAGSRVLAPLAGGMGCCQQRTQ